MKYTPEQLKEAYDKMNKVYDWCKERYGDEHTASLCGHDLLTKSGAYFREDIESLKDLVSKLAIMQGVTKKL